MPSGTYFSSATYKAFENETSRSGTLGLPLFLRWTVFLSQRKEEHSSPYPQVTDFTTVNLLEYIRLQNDELKRSSSRTTQEKTAQFVTTITEYCDADTDLRMAQTTPFVMGYGKSITDGSGKTYSPTVANECVERLRGIIRKAIRDKVIPNYDPIPEALDRLRNDVWGLEVKAESPVKIDLRLTDAVLTLTRKLTWIFANRSIAEQSDDPQQRRRLREETTDARAVLIYLFSLFFYGLDIESILRLKASEPSENSECFIPKYGRALPIPAVALSLARMHNEGKICTTGDRLFSVISDTDTDAQIAAKAKRIMTRARKWLRRQEIPLATYPDTFSEWLSLAAETGAPAAAIETAIQCAVSGRLTEIDEQTWLDLNRSERSVATFLQHNWYVLCSYSTTFRGEKLRSFIARSGIFGTETEAYRRLYNPTDNTDERPTETSAISRFVFLKANPIEAMLIDRLRRDAALLRVSRTRQFAIVPQHEIEIFQVALRDFRDDVDLVDREEWIAAHRKEFAKSQKVIIHTGPFKGREATIIDIKTPKAIGSKARGTTVGEATEPHYLLSLAHATFTIVATRTALALDAAP